MKCFRLFLSGMLMVSMLLILGTPVLASDYKTIIEKFTEDNEFNGVILLAHNNRIVFHRSYGYADFESQIHTSLNTRYQLGSISKLISSIIVLDLVEQGRLSLNAPISDYLPDYRKDTGSKITLHHLLSHTSGVPNDIIAAVKKNPSLAEENLSQAEAVRLYASGDLIFEPGSRFDYSHSNWILVKAIIEKVTKHSLQENYRDIIVKPLKLKNTGIFTGEFSSIADSAKGYVSLKPTPKENSSPTPDFIACAGGFYSTGSDLLRLINAVYGGRVLTKRSLESLTKVYVPEENYAYGGRVRQITLRGKKQVVLWHSGSSGAFKSRLTKVLDKKWTVILLSNTNADMGKIADLNEQILSSLYN